MPTKSKIFSGQQADPVQQAHHTPLNQRSVFFFIISSVPVRWRFDPDPWICALDYGSVHWIIDPDSSRFIIGFENANKKFSHSKTVFKDNMPL
jgi:hypothetical protein